MQLAERREDRFGAEAERRRAARVPGRPGIRRQSQVRHRRARRFEQRQYFGLGVKRVEALSLAGLPVAGGSLAGQQDRGGRPLAFRQVAAADLEQSHRRGAAVDVAAGGGEEPGKKRRTHRFHLLADRIGEGPRRAAEPVGVSGRNEAPVDRLVETAARRSAAHAALDRLNARRGRPRDPFGAGQRGRRDLVVAVEPDDFLDEVGGPVDIAAPARDDRVAPIEAETEPIEDRALLFLGDRHPAERQGQRWIECDAF